MLLLERLREVNALVGFTRVESPDEGTADERAPRAPLTTSPRRIGCVATQVHGEGIFVRFETALLEAWAERDAVKAIDARLRAGHRGWRQKRGLEPERGLPRRPLRDAPHPRPPADPGAGAGVRLQRGEHPGADLCRRRGRERTKRAS